MPSVDVNSPISSAPTNRLALGVASMRPGAGDIGGSASPATYLYMNDTCFEGAEE